MRTGHPDRRTAFLMRQAGAALVAVLGVLTTTSAQTPAMNTPVEPAPASQNASGDSPETQPADLDLDNLLNDQGDSGDAIDLYNLDIPMVVTASRREEPITATPHAISVITAEDIRRSGARTIGDALRLAPGVDVADIGLYTYAISPRGFHGFLSNKTLVLVDGRQIYDAAFGGTDWQGWGILLEDIERIEVIRGPAGVTWGPNAVNGVINIITRDPADLQGLTLKGGGGSRGSYQSYTGLGYTEEPLSLRVSGQYESSDGALRGGSFLSPLDDSYWNSTGTATMKYRADEHDLWTFSGGSSSGQYGQDTSIPFSDSIHRFDRGSHFMTRWDRTLEKDNEVSLTGYVNEYAGSSGLAAIDYGYQQIALQLGHTLKPDPAHQLSWGVDTRMDLFDASNADPFMASKDHIQSGLLGIYLNDQWTLAERWRLDLGARVDYDSYAGFLPSGRAALMHQIDDRSSVYAAVSHANQSVPAAARFFEIPILGGLAWIDVDRDIPSTTLMAYELGYRSQPMKNLEFSITPFWHEYDGVQTRSLVPPGPGLVHLNYDSRGDASLYGIELDGKYRLSPELMFLGNYTYQQLDWRSRRNFADTDYLTPPEHKFMIAARYSLSDDLHLSSHLYYVDEVISPSADHPFRDKTIDSYFRLDLRGEWEFWGDQGALAVGVRNLLDSYHPEGETSYLNSAEIPRFIYAEIRLTFK